MTSFWRLIAAAVAGAVLAVILATVGLYVESRVNLTSLNVNFAPKPSGPSDVVASQTEAIFLEGAKPLPDKTDEWWSARSDHRLVAYAVFACRNFPNLALDTLPRQLFSALMLDLTPTGNHVFVTDSSQIATREKTASTIVLEPSDHDVISLSDSIARARLAAFEGASSNVPWVQRLGLFTLAISALATLFVTLQGKMTPYVLEGEEEKSIRSGPLWTRTKYVLGGPGSGFRWVAFFAIALSIAGTSLTGLKQVYDPTRNLTQNTRALLDLRQLHQEVILGIRCDDKHHVTFPRLQEAANAIRRIRATIIPDYGAYANLDVGGSSQQPDPTRRGGESDPRAIEAARERVAEPAATAQNPRPASSETTPPPAPSAAPAPPDSKP